MQDTIREYNAQFTEAITLYNEIQKRKEEKKGKKLSHDGTQLKEKWALVFSEHLFFETYCCVSYYA
jgi:hypothetical protein